MTCIHEDKNVHVTSGTGCFSVLFSESEDDLENLFRNCIQKAQLKINLQKSKVMVYRAK